MFCLKSGENRGLLISETKVREKGYDVDVIIVSAANDKDKIKQALRLGAVDYIIKPFEFERFNLALQNYQNRHNIVEDQDVIQQEELDKTIISHDVKSEAGLPKGLDKHTLQVVWQYVQLHLRDYPVEEGKEADNFAS